MKVTNRKASFNYKLFDKYETGVSLVGGEVKAIKNSKVDLSQAYVKIIENEAYLINAQIDIPDKKNYSPTRARKLLLHKKEIVSIRSKVKAKKLTIVPTKMYNKGRLIKLEIALAKYKRKHEKRQEIKKKDIDREIERELKGTN